MNIKKNYSKGYRLEIMKLLYMNGAISYNTLKLLPGSPLMNERAYRKLRDEGVLELIRHAGRRMIIFKNYEDKKSEYEEYMPLGYSDYYYDKSKEIRTKVKRGTPSDVERAARCGEVLAMMHTAGINAYMDNCPKYSWNQPYSPNESYYHNSFDIKNASIQYPSYTGEDKNIASTRIIGCVNSPGGDYGVYSVSKGLIEWSRSGELKAATHLKRLSQSIYGIDRNVNAILYIKDLMLIERIVNNENIKRTVNLISIDNVYPEMYALPIDDTGIKMTSLLKEEFWKEHIYSKFITEAEYNNAKGLTVACDGYDGEHYKLVYCVPDITKLKLFLRKAQADLDFEKYVLYCFDWQEKHIREMAGHLVQINVVPFKEFYEKLSKKLFIMNNFDDKEEKGCDQPET